MADQQRQAVPLTMEHPTPKGLGPLRVAGRLAKSDPTMTAGLAIIAIMVVIAILAPVFFTYDPNMVYVERRFVGPSFTNWFGTDVVGRDVYSRTIYGTRVSLSVAAAVGSITILLASAIGLMVGYIRWVDMAVMRIVDALIAFPPLLLAIAWTSVFGGSVRSVILVLCIISTPGTVRIVRSAVLGLREQMFVDAAVALGSPTHRILARHILPNTVAPLIVQGTFIAGSAVLLEAYISFLGAGVSPYDTPTWGGIMADGRNYLSRAVWIILFPGLFLTFTVLGINIAGDGLRDKLDPKLRRRM